MKNKKGFTLIELLAVIVILGLLMAIAIPSVTKYIQQSRKKTLIDTVNSYSEAAVTGVNALEYGSMSDSNNLYYIPIECLSIEKGGTNPFGDWEEAYVVVHYNAEEYTYDYYFTYYDSAGYGMKLTPINELKYTSLENPTEINKDTITTQTLNGEDVYIASTDKCSFNSEDVTINYNISLSETDRDFTKIKSYYTASKTAWVNPKYYYLDNKFHGSLNSVDYFAYVNENGKWSGYVYGNITTNKKGEDISTSIVKWELEIKHSYSLYGRDYSLGNFTCTGKGNKIDGECNPSNQNLILAPLDYKAKSSMTAEFNLKLYLKNGDYLLYKRSSAARNLNYSHVTYTYYGYLLYINLYSSL